MRTTSREWTRRDFFRSAGIVSAAGLLSRFVPVSYAQTQAQSIKRLFLFCTPDGTILNRWRSNGTGTALVGAATIATPNSMKTPELKGPILAPLERHRPNLTLVDGMDIKSGMLSRVGSPKGSYSGVGHNGIACLWSGARQLKAPASGISDPTYANAKTIDQILAASSGKPAIVACTSNDTFAPTMGYFSYSDAGQPLKGVYDPKVLFDLTFGSGAVMTGDDGAAKRRAARLSILNGVTGELGRLRKELPAVDQQRLDAHLASVQDLDQRITATSSNPVSCTPGTRPTTSGTDNDPVTRLTLHTEIIQHAFACDLTRVASLALGVEASTPSWNGDNVHTNSHLTYTADTNADRLAAIDAITRLQNSAAELFAKMIDSIDGASLLDDTLMVWGMGHGWAGPHVNWNAPFVLASKHPALKTGMYFRYGNYNLDIDGAPNGWNGAYFSPTIQTPHNKLLVTLCHLMGRTDITAVGDKGVNGEVGGADIDNTPLTELMS